MEMDEDTITTGLKKHFKFDKFKSDLQKRAVFEICQRKHDVFVSMPTGSGKSLCYQLPAVLYSNKITIVFSPLLALIKDQVDHLTYLKIRAATINSKISSVQRQAIIADLKSTSPNIRILYVTPEQAATATFKALYENLYRFNKLAYLVVDEAHCVSEWGHDFRPQYQKLGNLRENVDVPCIALTATANSEVIKDIISSLRLGKDYKTFKTSCFRDNLFYDVYFPNMLDDPYIHLRNFIAKCLNLEKEKNLPNFVKSCGIIYCRTRDQTEMLMEKLNKLGIKSLCYHAGLKSEERKVFQEKWQNGDVPVICATISFGMGVDKATVRFVIHWGSPKEPASFYQESGRAGRDGKPSRCRVYYNRSDSKAIEFHLAQDLGKAGSKENKKKRVEEAAKGFRKILEFCENPSECRHKLFTDHFGEPPPDCKDKCDYCLDQYKVKHMVEQFLTKSIQFSTKVESYSETDFTDLYGEGRHGITQDQREYNDENGSDDAYSFESEQKLKKAANEFIQKQFALRRNTNEVSQETVDKLFSKHSRVKAAASTSNKVKGLTLSTREQYVTKLLDLLYANYTKCQEDPVLDRKDVEDCSVNVEYEVFTATTNMTMYRNSLAKMISNIKKLTDDGIVYEKLLTFEPEQAKHETLSDLFRNIKKQQQLRKLESFSETAENDNGLPAFKTARQALEEVKGKSSNSQNKVNSYFKKASELLEEQTQVSSEESVANFEVNMNSAKRDFKSLFGDESDDEEMVNIGSRHSFSANNKEGSHEKFSKDKHKHKSSNSDKKDDKKEHKSKKRSYSSDRKDDKKRLKENSSKENHKNKQREYEDLEAAEECGTEESSQDLDVSQKLDEPRSAAATPTSDWEQEDDQPAFQLMKDIIKNRKESPKQEVKKHQVVEEAKQENHVEAEDMKYVLKLDLAHSSLRNRPEILNKNEPDNKNQTTHGLTRNNKFEELINKHKESNINQIPTPPILNNPPYKPLVDNRRKPKLKKSEVGGLVVKLLTPAYAEKRFESRDIFKTLARNISHALADKDENEIKEYVQRFLEKNEEITSRTTL